MISNYQAYIKYMLKKHQALLLIFTVLLCTIFPVVPVFYKLMQSTVVSKSGGIALLKASTLIITLVSPYLYFDYIRSRKAIDVFHALPISRGTLFVSNCLLSVLTTLIPFTISYVIGSITMSLISADPLQLIEASIHYFRLVIMIISIQLPIIFVLVNTGAILDAIIYSTLALLLPFLAWFAISSFLNTYIVGFSYFSDIYIYFISPVYSLFSNPNHLNTNLIIPFYWTLLSLIMFVSSKRIYERFKSERSESPTTNHYFYPLILNISAFIFYMFMFSFFTYIRQDYYPNSIRPTLSILEFLLPAIFTYVLYILLDGIKNRNLKKLVQSTKHYLVFMLLTSAFIFTTYNTNGFGFADALPETSEITAADLKIYEPILQYPFNFSEDDYDYSYFFTEKENIAFIKTYHQEIIEFLSTSEPYESEENYTINIIYHHGTTKSTSRTYTLPKEALANLYPLTKTAEFQKQVNPLLNKNNTLSAPEVFNKIFTEKYDVTIDLDVLIDLYLEDLETMSNEAFLYTSSELKYNISYYFKGNKLLAIDTRFPKTLRYLESLGMNTKPHSDYSYYQSARVSDNPKDMFYFSSCFYGNFCNLSELSLDYSFAGLETKDVNVLDLNPSGIYRSKNELNTLIIMQNREAKYILPLN